MRIALSRATARALPADVTEAWLELQLGARTAESARVVVVDGAAEWLELALETADALAREARVRVWGERAGKERLLAELEFDCTVDLVQDLTIGCGSRGLLTCTALAQPSAAGSSTPAAAAGAAAPPAARTAGAEDVSLQSILGVEPIVPLFSRPSRPSRSASDDGTAPQPIRPSRSSSDADGRSGASAAVDGVDAKLSELLATFFALESTQAFVSVALQNVAVGLRADALISPFAKPRLPQGPGRLRLRWSVSGASGPAALATPQTAQGRRQQARSRRMTWHYNPNPPAAEALADSPAHTPRGALSRGVWADDGLGGGAPVGGDALLRISAPPPPPGSELPATRRFSAIAVSPKKPLSPTPRSRAAICGGAAAGAADECEVATFWLPLPPACADAPLVGATAELAPGEVVSLDEALARTAERAKPKEAAVEGLARLPASPEPEPPTTIERTQSRRKMSLMLSTTPDQLLALRVERAFSTRNGDAPAAAADGAPPALSESCFVRVCREVLELPLYVAHAVHAQIQARAREEGEGGEGEVSLRACLRYFGSFKVEQDERRRVFDALLGHADGRRPGARAEVSAAVLERVVRAVLQLHGGLAFLADHDEFREAYVQTVCARILFSVAGPGRRSIAWSRWRACELTETLFALADEPDINRCADYFGYNDFYVVWCLFWELDEDEDSRLGASDVARYNQYALLPRAVQRVLAMREETPQARAAAGGGGGGGGGGGERSVAGGGGGERSVAGGEQPDSASASGAEGGADEHAAGGSGVPPLTIGYEDFVRFVLAEEDKASRSSLRYWFTVLDLDDDGALSRDDVRYFYEEQHARMVALGEEAVSFAELFNELTDMAAPARPGLITLADLERCGLGAQIIDAIVNVRKLVAWESLSCQKAAGRATHLRGTRDWNTFVTRQYGRLVEAEAEKAEEEEALSETISTHEPVSEREDDDDHAESPTSEGPLMV